MSIRRAGVRPGTSLLPNRIRPTRRRGGCVSPFATAEKKS
ncbi:hypothetical protein [Azospirillum argentinense]